MPSSALSIHVRALLSSRICRHPAPRDTLRLNPNTLSALVCLSCQPLSHDSSGFLLLLNVQAHLLHFHLHPYHFKIAPIWLAQRPPHFYLYFTGHFPPVKQWDPKRSPLPPPIPPLVRLLHSFSCSSRIPEKAEALWHAFRNRLPLPLFITSGIFCVRDGPHRPADTEWMREFRAVYAERFKLHRYAST